MATDTDAAEMATTVQRPWPEDLAEGERIRVTGPGGSGGGLVTRAASSDRFTYRADDGVRVERLATEGR